MVRPFLSRLGSAASASAPLVPGGLLQSPWPSRSALAPVVAGVDVQGRAGGSCGCEPRPLVALRSVVVVTELVD